MSLEDALPDALRFAGLDGASASTQREGLLGALGDGDWRVRREAALALVRSPDRAAVIERLIDRVLGDDIAARNAALDALRTLRAAAAPPVLARLARVVGPRRRFLVEALMEGITAETLPAVRALLDDPDPNLPPAAIEVVSALRDPAATPVLVDALAHRDPVVRIGALLALQARGKSAPLEALLACVHDPLTVRPALAVLLRRPEREAFDGALQCIERGDRHALTAAIRACESLGRVGDPGLSTRLIGAWPRWCAAVLPFSADPREQLAVPAVWMLGHAASEEAAAAVLGALSHPLATVRAAADDALDVLVTHAPTLALRAAAAVSVAQHRAVLRALASTPAPLEVDALAALARVLDDPMVGVDALAALAAHAPEASLDGLWVRVVWASQRWPERDDLGAVADTLLARATAGPRGGEPSFAPTRAGLAVALAWLRAGGSLDPELVDAALASTDDVAVAAGLRLVEALGDRRWSPAAEALLEHPALRGPAIAALRGCRIETAALAGWLTDPRPGHRLMAALSLAERALLPAAMAIALLDDAEPEVALAALHSLGPSTQGPWLHTLLRRGRPMLALEALAMVHASPPAEAMELQQEALAHADASVRIAAASSLDTGSQDARARLYLRLAEERDPEVAMHIERLLDGGGGLTGPGRG
ncbi:MAG: HEAT repeat domain-containing protein [Deltaproteobacteria bacterium]|nr:HEAT repeat domain-containing protein [Myxococcales bacterium]MDP3218878.1 HEAT repeat domain-containing protein [Deltaproteobacteria bacterium]